MSSATSIRAKVDEPGFLISLFSGIGSLFGASMFGDPFSAGCLGKQTNPRYELMMSRIEDSKDDPQYIKVKEAIDAARERIDDGGGLGNQDADLLTGVEDGLEAAMLSGELGSSFDSLMSTVNDLGRSTETMMP